jgi:hypothetical protein
MIFTSSYQEQTQTRSYQSPMLGMMIPPHSTELCEREGLKELAHILLRRMGIEALLQSAEQITDGLRRAQRSMRFRPISEVARSRGQTPRCSTEPGPELPPIEPDLNGMRETGAFHVPS